MKRAVTISILVELAACSSQKTTVGLDEPVRIAGAQFIEGDLPGAPPGGGGPVDLRVTSIASNNRVVTSGESGKKLEGRASARASAVGIRFADIGTGYWVFPLGPSDPQFPGELTWAADLDFNPGSDLTGFHPLRVVAIDPSGAAGEQGEIALCLASKTPDNLSSCDPNRPPPAAVITLAWDADVDLDLRVTLPGGRTVDSKHPLVEADADAGTAPASGIDRDSLAACLKDGRRQENLVFWTRPKGSVDVYAQLFDPCGRPGTTFDVVVYEAQAGRLVETQRVGGRMVATLAGQEPDQPPTYVTSYDFP